MSSPRSRLTAAVLLAGGGAVVAVAAAGAATHATPARERRPLVRPLPVARPTRPAQPPRLVAPVPRVRPTATPSRPRVPAHLADRAPVPARPAARVAQVTAPVGPRTTTVRIRDARGRVRVIHAGRSSVTVTTRGGGRVITITAARR